MIAQIKFFLTGVGHYILIQQLLDLSSGISYNSKIVDPCPIISNRIFTADEYGLGEIANKFPIFSFPTTFTESQVPF